MTASPPAVQRNDRGHFLPGVSGNPGGRTSALAEVRALLRPNVELYVQRLNELVRNPDPEIALPALREAFDRLLGKAVAVVEQDVRTTNLSALYLTALKMANGVVDVTPSAREREGTDTTTTPLPQDGGSDTDGESRW